MAEPATWAYAISAITGAAGAADARKGRKAAAKATDKQEEEAERQRQLEAMKRNKMKGALQGQQQKQREGSGVYSTMLSNRSTLG